MQSTTKVLKCYPTSAAGVTVQNSGTSLANTAFVQIHAAIPADWLLAGLLMSNSSSTSPSAPSWEIDIAVGGAGSEVVIATLRGARVAGGSQSPMNRFGILIDALPSGSRLSYRLRYQNATNTPGLHRVSVFYYDK